VKLINTNAGKMHGMQVAVVNWSIKVRAKAKRKAQVRRWSRILASGWALAWPEFFVPRAVAGRYIPKRIVTSSTAAASIFNFSTSRVCSTGVKIPSYRDAYGSRKVQGARLLFLFFSLLLQLRNISSLISRKATIFIHFWFLYGCIIIPMNLEKSKWYTI
jgi:hypothetical protein